MREKTVENYLVEAVEHLGGLCVKFPPLFFRGFPDRIVLAPVAIIVFVETKARGKKPSLIQRKVHARLRRLGFRVEDLDNHEDVDGFILTL